MHPSLLIITADWHAINLPFYRGIRVFACQKLPTVFCNARPEPTPKTGLPNVVGTHRRRGVEKKGRKLLTEKICRLTIHIENCADNVFVRSEYGFQNLAVKAIGSITDLPPEKWHGRCSEIPYGSCSMRVKTQLEKRRISAGAVISGKERPKHRDRTA